MKHRSRKPLTAWEPAPWLGILVFLMLGSLAIGATRGIWQTISFIVFTVGAIVIVIWVMRSNRGRANPNRDGALSSLSDISVIDAPGVGGPMTRVVDTHRFQSTLLSVGERNHDAIRAVLVPDANRWLGREFRVSVELVDLRSGRVSRAGFLAREHDQKWLDLLRPLREIGEYVSVPAKITGTAGARGLDVDLSGVESVSRSRGTG